MLGRVSWAYCNNKCPIANRIMLGRTTTNRIMLGHATTNRIMPGHNNEPHHARAHNHEPHHARAHAHGSRTAIHISYYYTVVSHTNNLNIGNVIKLIICAN